MKLIEKYQHEGEGYNPFLIREGWQVARLNHMSGQGVNDIQKVDVHWKTDEVFILIAGTAVLIAAEVQGENVIFEMISMQQGIVYNIPVGVWHNIAMLEDAQVIIVEKDETHLGNSDFYYLNEAQKESLNQQIISALK